MSTSPGSSSPRDLNIAPLAVAAVTTQTYGGLLTPPVQKRLEADISNQTLFRKRRPCFPGFDAPEVRHTFPASAVPVLLPRTAKLAGAGRRRPTPIGRPNAPGQLICRPGVRVCHNSQATYPWRGSGRTRRGCRPRLGHVWAVRNFRQFTFTSLTPRRRRCSFLFHPFLFLHQWDQRLREIQSKRKKISR